MAGKTVIPPQIFTVGVGDEFDFSPTEVDLFAYQLAEWFKSTACDRQYPDPIETAQELLRQCLLGLNASGDTWGKCPKDFYDRVRTKTMYDLRTQEGKSVKVNKSPDAQRAEKQRGSGAQEVVARNAALFGFDEAAFRKEQAAQILGAYPELDTAAHRPNVRRLALLYAQQEVIERELTVINNAKKRADYITTLEALGRAIEKVMKSLDIHPDQVRKRLDKQTEGSLADLVNMLAGDDEFAEREKTWSLTTALQLWWMSQHRNGRGDGPQVEDWEIWHMTRSRPMKFTCECGRHYPSIVQGFEPAELRDYLVREGVIVEVPMMPHLMGENALEGLLEYSEDGEAEDEDGGDPVDLTPEVDEEVSGEE